MISSDIVRRPPEQAPVGVTRGTPVRKQQGHWLSVCTFLLLACVGASWFAYQYFLTPEPDLFTAPWQGAQWVQAADGNAPVAYFRDVVDLNVLPDASFVSVAANQVFRLYVNGVFIGSNAADIVQGSGPRSYIYDVASALQAGQNVLGLRVANLDKQPPSVRASFGIVHGKSLTYRGTGDGWQATAQSTLVYHRYVSARSLMDWTTSAFDASSWRPVQKVANALPTPLLRANPLLYEQPLSTRWINAGASHEAYIVRAISLPLDITDAWLRIVATGPASIFINGKLDMAWNGQAPIPQQPQADYLSGEETTIQYQKGLVLGIYNISPYLHPGVNTIAIHVAAPGLSAAGVGLSTLSAALSVDILTDNLHGQNTWFTVDTGWHASARSVDGWEEGANAAFEWPAPFFVSRPGVSQAVYLPNSASPRDANIFPFGYLCEIVLGSVAAVLGLWLLMSLFVLRRAFVSVRDALQALSMAYLPALALEGLLIVLAREPQLTQLSLYTWQWGVVLLLFVGLGYLCICLDDRVRLARRLAALGKAALFKVARKILPAEIRRPAKAVWQNLRVRLPGWLRVHWGLVVLFVLAIPMICYNLNYEPYWQDSLTSYYAAKGVLAHGLPLLPSGFLYAKAELYSYVLALSIAIFGEQNGALRIPSMLEYLVSLPIFYAVACYFFQRRVALLATAMLAFSPYTLRWASEVRMYEQAQLMAIIVMYLFYRALQERLRPRYIYLAMLSLIVMYLSHEETFIILPALVLCALLASWKSRDIGQRLPWILYQKHWWFATLLGVSVIGLQLLVVKVSHPAVLGTDQSQQPLIGLSVENLSFYVKLLFSPGAVNSMEPNIILNVCLAVAACWWGIRRADTRTIYCALFLFVSLLTLAVTFSLVSDRYIYPLLPAMYLIGAQVLVVGIQGIWTLARTLIARRHFGHRSGHVSQEPPFLWMRLMLGFTTVLVCASVLILPLLPVGNFSLFISRVAGFAYHRHMSDHDAVGQYIHQHWQRGDVVI
ncbi:MAG: glycosyltransferase family 39 protein, partial [Ktedonobacteraceae bacterium]